MQWWSEDAVPRSLRYFDNQNIQDMKEDEQEEAKTTSRRVEKLSGEGAQGSAKEEEAEVWTCGGAVEASNLAAPDQHAAIASPTSGSSPALPSPEVAAASSASPSMKSQSTPPLCPPPPVPVPVGGAAVMGYVIFRTPAQRRKWQGWHPTSWPNIVNRLGMSIANVQLVHLEPAASEDEAHRLWRTRHTAPLPVHHY